MHLIYLAGNSLNNKTWIETVKSHFASFSGGDILYYDHWQTGDKWINLAKESEKLAKLIKDETDYGVFAKSMGTILALKGIGENFFHPQFAVFCGLAYPLAKKESVPIDDYLKVLTIPTVFIQNEFDPVFNYSDLNSVLSTLNPPHYRLIKIPQNSTHDYEDYSALSSLVKTFSS